MPWFQFRIGIVIHTTDRRAHDEAADGVHKIEQALAARDIDMKSSWMIGDKNIDVETAINAGVRSGMVRTGYGRKHEAILWTQPDLIDDDLGLVSEKVVQLAS